MSKFDQSGLTDAEIAFELSIQHLPLQERVRRRSILSDADVEQASKVIRSKIMVNDSLDVDQILKMYKENYDRWDPRTKSNTPWKLLEERFLANECYNLEKADEIERKYGSILFGVDSNGNPLISNADLRTIMARLTYEESRRIVLAEGYELFPYVEPYSRSREIFLFEEFTGLPFVKSGSIWLESGSEKSNPTQALSRKLPKVAGCYGNDNEINICSVSNLKSSPTRGVRILLRMRG